ncbi:membrane-spanning 4-domains subfamily A member 12-like [Clarias gariepinus]|uniref:membrane-spanning 4-domains subfamily A member 12-like n=1 Tax=Clarias gariepinus TaxID=13013 RepID=UPI00234C5559|nr:membrane-spanning 4-domains subfamily A member 12-like [Clarias gariepinus]
MPLPAIKVDQKSLGPVQVMIGVVIFMFGIITKDISDLSVLSRVMFWGSVSFFCSGATSAATVDHRHSFLVKSSLILNLISTIAALVAVIVLSIDLVNMSAEVPWSDLMTCQISAVLMLLRRTYRVLLFLSITEVCMSIWTFVLIWKSRDST